MATQVGNEGAHGRTGQTQGPGPGAGTIGPGPSVAITQSLWAGGGRRAAGGRANSDPTGVHPPTQNCYPPAGGDEREMGTHGNPEGFPSSPPIPPYPLFPPPPHPLR